MTCDLFFHYSLFRKNIKPYLFHLFYPGRKRGNVIYFTPSKAGITIFFSRNWLRQTVFPLTGRSSKFRVCYPDFTFYILLISFSWPILKSYPSMKVTSPNGCLHKQLTGKSKNSLSINYSLLCDTTDQYQYTEHRKKPGTLAILAKTIYKAALTGLHWL